MKILLSTLFNRLQLKGETFKVSTAASEAAIDDMWKSAQEVESSLVRRDKLRKEHLPQKENLKAFIDHCCTLQHYLAVKKRSVEL